MQQITSHVDWSLSVLMIVLALVQFLSYSIKMYERRIMSALIYLGVACISVVTATGITFPRLIHEGAGIASLPVLACLVLGLCLLAVGSIGSLVRSVKTNFKGFKRTSSKSASASTTTS